MSQQTLLPKRFLLTEAGDTEPLEPGKIPKSMNLSGWISVGGWSQAQAISIFINQDERRPWSTGSLSEALSMRAMASMTNDQGQSLRERSHTKEH